MRARAGRPGALLLVPSSFLFMSMCLAGMSAAADPPAPAEGAAALRFATVTARLTPPRIDPGERGLLEITLVPAEGFAWHEAPAVPSRVDVYPPAGWEAEPAELELPLPEGPEGDRAERAFAVTVTAGPSAEGRRKLDLEISYGVRDARGDAPGGGKVCFEDVRLEVEVPPPELAPAREVGVPGTPGTLVMRPAPRPPREPEVRGGSPVLPVLFFMVASLLVLAGVAVAVRRA
ncbi:MAG: hypothetical protein ACYS9X_27045, partial [Planctomycetota bacterium]